MLSHKDYLYVYITISMPKANFLGTFLFTAVGQTERQGSPKGRKAGQQQ
jgi:hypothetical protein